MPKILFVDDELHLLESIKDVMRKENFEVITATSGVAALEILEDEIIDVVVSDERMPIMSGHEFLAKVCALYPATVRILLTGQASLESITAAINQGQIYHFISKPFSPPRLKAVLNDALVIRQSMSRDSHVFQACRAYGPMMARFERNDPGITQVQMDEQGAISIPVEPTDLTHPLTLDYELRKAMAQNRLDVHYQPQVSLYSDRIIGAEALLRWHHPEFGYIPPADYIAIAEQSGLIVDLGNYVLHKACATLQRLQNEGHDGIKIAVNVSPRQITSANFVATVQALIREYELDPTGLELEITETFVIGRVDRVIAILGELHALGLTISIDDFGAGYSGLSYLKRIPAQFIKIDRSFILDICTDRKAQLLVLSIIQLAQKLKLKVVAEGIESVEQAALLASWSCDYGQGYLYSQAVDQQILLDRLSADMGIVGL